LLLLSSGIKTSFSFCLCWTPSSARRTCNIRSARRTALFRPLGVDVKKLPWDVETAVARVLLRPRALERESRNRIGVMTEGTKSSVGGFAHRAGSAALPGGAKGGRWGASRKS
jgi:hypothetical protein